MIDLMSKQVSLGTIVLLLALTTACERSTESSPLIDGLSSGLSKSEASERLGSLAAGAATERPEEINGGASAGGVTVERIRIAGFHHLDHEGELTLAFYNDRLVMTIFRPATPDAYLKSLSSAYSNDFTSHRELRVEPSTIVWWTTNKQEGSFAGWEDSSLVKEYDTYEER